MRRAGRLALAAGIAAALSACATPPPPAGTELRAEILFVHRAEDLARMTAASPPVERANIETSGFAAAVRDGRALRLRCALDAEEVLVADAIAPPGLALTPGRTVRLVWGSQAPVVPNRVLGPVTDPRLARGTLTRQQVGRVQLVPWSSTPVLAPLESWQAAEYAPVRGYALLRCRPVGSGDVPATQP